jgi:hypothetical protein
MDFQLYITISTKPLMAQEDSLVLGGAIETGLDLKDTLQRLADSMVESWLQGHATKPQVDGWPTDG